MPTENLHCSRFNLLSVYVGDLEFICPASISELQILSQTDSLHLDILEAFVNYKLVLAKGIWHLPLQRLNPVLLQLLTFDTP